MGQPHENRAHNQPLHLPVPGRNHTIALALSRHAGRRHNSIAWRKSVQFLLTLRARTVLLALAVLALVLAACGGEGPAEATPPPSVAEITPAGTRTPPPITGSPTPTPPLIHLTPRPRTDPGQTPWCATY